MKKNLFYYLFAVLCTVTMFTSCSDDDNGGESNAIEAGTFTDNSGLSLTYSGAPMLGKKVVFTPDAADPTKAVLELSGENLDITGLLPMSSGRADLGTVLKTPGVIPGEVTTTLNVVLQQEGDKVLFTGTDEKDGRVIDYKGEVMKGSMILDLNVTIPQNELVGKTLTILPSGEIDPLHLVWNADEFPFGDGTWDVNSALLMVVMSTQIEGKTIPQLLTGVFDKVTFLPDGNIQAAYKDTPADGEWKNSSLNLAMYKVGTDNKIYVYLNPAQIIAESSKGRAADISSVLGNLLPVVLPMLSDGVPVSYQIEGNSVVAYLGADVLKPVLDAVAPLFTDAEFVDVIVNLLKEQAGDMGALVEVFLKPVLLQMPTIIETTTDIQLGLKFTLPTEETPAA